ncbi:MAG: transposase [Deltaproteobacteria bacterium]|nr:transposase [Deltaproteobacteria bacterium]
MALLCSAVEAMFRSLGAPRHVITDKEPVFTGGAFRELLGSWNVKHRLGAVGKHGSIAVTERVIRTLKYEWLRRVPLIRGLDHLESLCKVFAVWYNAWRPYALLDGACPDRWYCRDIPETVDRDAKVVPIAIERRVFEETGVVGFRLGEAAQLRSGINSFGSGGPGNEVVCLDCNEMKTVGSG